MAWAEHVSWIAFALVGLSAFAGARALDLRDERLEPRSKRVRSRPPPRGDRDATERIDTRTGKRDSVGRPSMSSDRPSHTSDRPSWSGERSSAPPGERSSAPPAERASSPPGERVSNPGDPVTTSSGESTRHAFDRGSLPPD